ncbi:hypothetical protein [Arthrobacter sp. PAMC25564]|nr:hypothetical protein [Arthrobacter sp. PAMC25564]
MNTAPHVGIDDLQKAAEDILKLNDLGAMTTAAPNFHPHMWSF